jgi:SAM-dependent methyltransferase
MSLFSSVDGVAPERAAAYLERVARGQRGMKHYAAAAHARREPDGFVLDLGCGAGPDLVLLGGAGVRAVGVDPSAFLLAEARRATAGAAPLVRATGEALPFHDGSLGGCRIERVLMHVHEPAAILAEVARCLRAGSLLTVFEPDWSSFRVRCEHGSAPAGWIAGARHPDVGGTLWELAEAMGFDVADRVEELSVWRSPDQIGLILPVDESVELAVAAGRISRADATEWLREQHARADRGEFHATIAKVMIVAVRR